MTGSVLLDTNLLVYAYDRSDLRKQRLALELLRALAGRRRGAVSTQVLGEFLVTITRKPLEPLPLEAALREVDRHLQTWQVLDVTSEVVREAVRGVRDHRLNYWDAQIWAVARLNRIPMVLSEDFSDGAVLEGVRFLNPLRADYSPASRL